MRRALLLALAGTLGIAIVAALPDAPAAYRAARLSDPLVPADSTAPLRSRLAANMALVSVAGLPPVEGSLVQSAGSVVFHPLDGGEAVVLPLFRTIAGAGRRPAVRLLEVAGGDDDPVFLFHLGAAVVETAAPGVLGELAAEPSRVNELGNAWTTGERMLAPRRDAAAAATVIEDLVRSTYAESLFAALGAPSRPIGIVDVRGVRAGRLGEYITRRDSIALSPSRMRSTAQLRHALAHELAHRWLRERPDTARQLTETLRPIRDSLRYGYHDRDEHLAEALAFAVHFLQTTSRKESADVVLLDSYERLVPGTRDAVRLLITLAPYRQHPLAGSVWPMKASD